MEINKYTKNIIAATITAVALYSVPASAIEDIRTLTHTGTVAWLQTHDDGYTFVNLNNSNGGNVVGYYDGSNSAITTVLDNAKRLNQDVTIIMERGFWKIIRVR